MRILGISAFYHDSAAALIQDGEIVAAAQEVKAVTRIAGPFSINWSAPAQRCQFVAAAAATGSDMSTLDATR